MELPLELHPFEIFRHLREFWSHFLNDYDLRFPEGRLRRVLELDRDLSESDRNLHATFLKEMKENKDLISFLDWTLLFEWNEKWNQARTLSQIATLQAPSHDDAVLNAAYARLKEIEQAIRSDRIDDEPSLWKLLCFRWKFAALRDEADYLISRFSLSR